MQTSWLSIVRAFFRRLFRTRNVIVISEHAVGHYPLSVKWQILALILLLGGVCWVSYSTGSFVAAKQVLAEKEQKLQQVSEQNLQMGQAFTVLKQDLTSQSPQSAKQLSAEARNILDNFEPEVPENLGQNLKNDAAERIRTLEQRVAELKVDNERMIQTVRSKTQGKIDELESVIASTGLDKDLLISQAAKQRKKAEKAAERDNAEAGERARKGFKNQGGPFEPTASVRLSPDEEAMNRSLDQLMILNDVVEILPLGRPIKNAQMMSPFGRRIDPFNGGWANHTGMDLAAPDGSKIFAANGGVVTFTGRKGAYGNAIDIEHGFGISTRYGHLSQILVKEGDKITKGQVIGVQGSTGRSTGDHLHYEVRVNDRPVNPRSFLDAGASL